MEAREPEKATNLEIITNVIGMGDSLTERGTMAKRKLFDVIPMRGIAGLAQSPEGRFTNNYAWSDYLIGDYILKFIKKKIRYDQRNSKETQIAHLAISDEQVQQEIQKAFTFRDDRTIGYKDNPYFLRSYCEGGMTSEDYTKRHEDIKMLGARKIVSNLGQKRAQLLEDDKRLGVTDEIKARSLVIEWSGANDLFTVNRKIDFKVIQGAVKSRIDNMRELIKNGYSHFVLLNLPDVALTPRFQNQDSDEVRSQASIWCSTYDQLLKAECEDLFNECRKEGVSVDIDLYDTTGIFKEVYDNPEKWGFDGGDTRKKQSKDAPAGDNSRHMFWDDIHPTSHFHHHISDQLDSFISAKYTITSTYEYEQSLREKRDKQAKLIKGGYIDTKDLPLNLELNKNADLSGADLHSAKLPKAKLPGVNLSGANLSDADLSNADLRNANLAKANLSGVDLSNAKLTGAIFTKKSFENLEKLPKFVADLPSNLGKLFDWKHARPEERDVWKKKYEASIENHLASLRERVEVLQSAFKTSAVIGKSVAEIICLQIMQQSQSDFVTPEYQQQLLDMVEDIRKKFGITQVATVQASQSGDEKEMKHTSSKSQSSTSTSQSSVEKQTKSAQPSRVASPENEFEQLQFAVTAAINNWISTPDSERPTKKLSKAYRLGNDKERANELLVVLALSTNLDGFKKTLAAFIKNGRTTRDKTDNTLSMIEFDGTLRHFLAKTFCPEVFNHIASITASENFLLKLFDRKTVNCEQDKIVDMIRVPSPKTEQKIDTTPTSPQI